MDGGSAGTSFEIGTIPAEYAPVLTTALATFCMTGSTSPIVQGAVDGEGIIYLRMNGSTNPQYFYMSGSWFVN